MGRTDSDLVTAAQKGDVGAYEELVRRYQSRAYGIALGVLHDPEEAKDVAQEAFLKVYRRLDRFKGDSSFYTWLYRIVVNLSIDHLRKRARSARIEYDDRLRRPDLGEQKGMELEPNRTDADPARNLMRKELLQAVERSLDMLSPKHKAVIVMREFQGMSYKEMAEVLGISIGTVMSRLFHARRKLQALLAEYLDEGESSL